MLPDLKLGLDNKALPVLQTKRRLRHCVGGPGMLSCSSDAWLTSKNQITPGLFCRRASAQPAARALGIY